jgi:hypothetical protein
LTAPWQYGALGLLQGFHNYQLWNQTQDFNGKRPLPSKFIGMALCGT